MPYVYTLELTSYRDAGTIQADWQSIAGEAIAHSYGGVTVSGNRAVVVSTPREPNYGDMETTFGYVASVTEHKEIPKRSDSSFDPPLDLGYGFTLAE